MIPIIVVSSDQEKLKKYLDDYILKNKISLNFIFEIKPEGKEISIEQIREIKKNVIYSNNEGLLFILFEFDKASFEAQNAFLKTLEEHQENLHFLLIVKNHYNLTATITSRGRIVVLKDSNQIQLEPEFSKRLENFLKKTDFKILYHKKFQAKEYSQSSFLFDKFINFFRLRIVQDKKAVEALKETLNLRALVENNNVDPQGAVDYLLIRISKIYQPA